MILPIRCSWRGAEETSKSFPILVSLAFCEISAWYSYCGRILLGMFFFVVLGPKRNLRKPAVRLCCSCVLTKWRLGGQTIWQMVALWDMDTSPQVWGLDLSTSFFSSIQPLKALSDCSQPQKDRKANPYWNSDTSLFYPKITIATVCAAKSVPSP